MIVIGLRDARFRIFVVYLALSMRPHFVARPKFRLTVPARTLYRPQRDTSPQREALI